MAKNFDIAQSDEVVINCFHIEESDEEKIPLEDIPSIKANISVKEIVEILRETRERG
jgi:hypothetical protein